MWTFEEKEAGWLQKKVQLLWKSFFGVQERESYLVCSGLGFYQGVLKGHLFEFWSEKQ